MSYINEQIEKNSIKEEKLKKEFPKYAANLKSSANGLIVTFVGLSKKEAKALLKAAKKVNIKEML